MWFIALQRRINVSSFAQYFVTCCQISMLKHITKTRLYNFDPLKPHFYTVKLGFTRVYIDWLQSFLFLYLFLSFSTLFFFIMILFNPTSSYLWLNSQGTEVNKNSTSYTSVVSPQKKKRKKEKKNKERVWGQTRVYTIFHISVQNYRLWVLVRTASPQSMF